MTYTILITGASSGFGAMTARALADAGHTVYATMRETEGRNAPKVAEARNYATSRGVDLRTAEMDVADAASVGACIAQVESETGGIDVLIHNAGHMGFGPTEAFSPEDLARYYDSNVLSTQRVNRAALPAMRARGRGLVLWVGSSSTRGGTPPFLGPYFAAKAGMDALAVSYAAELAPWGIETTIMVPGAFTSGTNHFAHAGRPSDPEIATAYMDGPLKGVDKIALDRLAALEPDDADPADVARAIVRVVDMPFSKRPFRVHVDPSRDGSEEVNAVADRVRREIFWRMGLESLLRPAAKTEPAT
ncbi:SDR family oxidoreductase [Sagittula sp. MA-2]|jgi:NAD(P)-dependent dehydrogenase (short-subunit alcohol dehydrogenase family)|uniref:SDR family oxidoreductase n=1 Tax=Sagittula sp. MA-2 TaxID=3048007 RepID=UPI0024C3A7D1|nr:SDR family oxidoreductase [Sagittula sp. MA-2]WHZ33664.1 SDR family oxidoreductase [Sagittula sp. MA-2]